MPKILVVAPHDSTGLLQIMSLLPSKGYEVARCHDVYDAYAAISKEGYAALLLSDELRPGSRLSLRSLVEDVLKTHPEVHIAIYDESGTTREAFHHLSVQIIPGQEIVYDQVNRLLKGILPIGI